MKVVTCRVVISMLVAFSFSKTLMAETSLDSKWPEWCQLEKREVKTLELSPDRSSLSYVFMDGEKKLLFSSKQGYWLRGTCIRVKPCSELDSPWLDVQESTLIDEKAFKFKSHSFQLFYMPLNHQLTPADLGLSKDWVIYDFLLDYDRAKQDYRDKFYQIAAKNPKTGEYKSFRPREIEEKLLESCGYTFKDLPKDYEFW